MKVIVDGRALQGNVSGIGKYLLSALQSFASLNVTCVILHNKAIDQKVKDKVESLGHITYHDKHMLAKNSLLWFVIRLPFLFKQFDFDFIWFPNNFGTFTSSRYRLLLTVHDAVYFDYPETMNWPEKFLSKIFLKKSILKSDVIWFVSKFTSNRYTEIFNISRKKIIIGSDIDRSLFCKRNFELCSRDVLDKYNIKGKYILFVGTTEPRKNLQFLSSISGGIGQLGLSIVVVGSKGWGEGNTDSKIIYPGYIHDNDLPSIFKFAELYISPSLYEGFGLPLIESQAMGTPVICANNSAQTEVISGSGIAISGWVRGEWLSAIEVIIDNRDKYSDLALKNSNKFSMDLVAESVVKEMHDFS
ncbi:glycosyltransferase family 4 protein [Shewanella vesiculosa]|uniref:glycosyltransferase family 4 protein n=1 Tax=Shewanella vesiculosa TaxID=518738 RepID=UPI003CFF6776